MDGLRARSGPRRRGLGGDGEQRDGAPRGAEDERRIGDPAEDRGLGDMEGDNQLAVANGRRGAVLVLAFPRRGRRARRAIVARKSRGGLRVAGVRMGVRELAVLARVVGEEQEIGELDELSEEQPGEDHQRGERRGPDARRPAASAPQGALGSRAVAHPACS